MTTRCATPGVYTPIPFSATLSPSATPVVELEFNLNPGGGISIWWLCDRVVKSDGTNWADWVMAYNHLRLHKPDMHHMDMNMHSIRGMRYAVCGMRYAVRGTPFTNV